MDTSEHSISNLFAQLGLPNSRQDIETFIESHRLSGSISIVEAEFWTQAQKTFIQESLAEDADWSEAVDTLDALLRH